MFRQEEVATTRSTTAQTTARVSVPTPSIPSGSNRTVHSIVTNVEVGFGCFIKNMFYKSI